MKAISLTLLDERGEELVVLLPEGKQAGKLLVLAGVLDECDDGIQQLKSAVDVLPHNSRLDRVDVCDLDDAFERRPDVECLLLLLHAADLQRHLRAHSRQRQRHQRLRRHQRICALRSCFLLVLLQLRRVQFVERGFKRPALRLVGGGWHTPQMRSICTGIHHKVDQRLPYGIFGHLKSRLRL